MLSMAQHYARGTPGLPRATTEDLNLPDGAWDLGTLGKPMTLHTEYTVSELTCSAPTVGCSSHSAKYSHGLSEIILNKTHHRL